MEKGEENAPKRDISAKQEQIHDLLFSREISWQEIIYDLINTEQLDPWDIDIGILTNKYLEKIRKLEEEDFFVSSKVLLAAAFLLRIKSELLLSKYLKSIDEILFGRKEQKQIQTINLNDLDFDDIPDLIPKSPLPRYKKVSLQELIDSLNKAIVTENRRIKKEIVNNNVLRETSISLPKRKFNLNTKSKEIYDKLIQYIKENAAEKISFTELAGTDKEERIISFLMLLNLDHQKKIWVEQKAHFEELYIWPRELYIKVNPNIFADLIEELGQESEFTESDAGAIENIDVEEKIDEGKDKSI